MTKQNEIILNNIKEKLKIHKPKLKDNSISQYIRMFQKIKHIDISEFNNIKEFIKDKKDSFKKNLCIAFLNYANIYKLKYISSIETYIKELNDEYNKNKYNKSIKEKDNWLEWNEILNIRKKLYKQVKAFDIHKKEKNKLNKQEYILLKKYVLISIYTYLPPRRLEIASLIKINKKKYDILIKSNNKLNENYLVIKNKSNMFFSYNVYKTDKIYNNQIIEIPKQLIKILLLWIKYNNYDYLFGNNVKHMTKNNLTKNLNDIFIPKKISVCMLRHIYLSSLFNIEQFKKDDKLYYNMGYSDKYDY